MMLTWGTAVLQNPYVSMKSSWERHVRIHNDVSGRNCCRRWAVKTDSEDNFKGRPFLPSKGKVLFLVVLWFGFWGRISLFFPGWSWTCDLSTLLSFQSSNSTRQPRCSGSPLPPVIMVAWLNPFPNYYVAWFCRVLWAENSRNQSYSQFLQLHKEISRKLSNMLVNKIRWGEGIIGIRKGKGEMMQLIIVIIIIIIIILGERKDQL